jgi:hypothetical protein
VCMCAYVCVCLLVCLFVCVCVCMLILACCKRGVGSVRFKLPNHVQSYKQLSGAFSCNHDRTISERRSRCEMMVPTRLMTRPKPAMSRWCMTRPKPAMSRWCMTRPKPAMSRWCMVQTSSVHITSLRLGKRDVCTQCTAMISSMGSKNAVPVCRESCEPQRTARSCVSMSIKLSAQIRASLWHPENTTSCEIVLCRRQVWTTAPFWSTATCSKRDGIVCCACVRRVEWA